VTIARSTHASRAEALPHKARVSEAGGAGQQGWH
jgi:hypothetical protein